MAEQSLKQIEKDVSDLRGKVDELIEIIQHLERDLHDDKYEVRSEYLDKLKKIESGKFLTHEEFENALRD